MAGRLIGKGSASSNTVASPSASRCTIERRVGSDRAAKTTSKRSGAVKGIVVSRADTSQTRYLTQRATTGQRAVCGGGPHELTRVHHAFARPNERAARETESTVSTPMIAIPLATLA